VMYHPVWTELDKAARQTRELLVAVNEIGQQVLWFWPNFDAGAEETVAHEMRAFKDQSPDNHIRFLRYLPPEQFLWLLRRTKCLVGNSSAGIKESSYLGVPVVNIGTRQGSRLRSENVVSVDHDKAAIQAAIRTQTAVGRFKPSSLYHADDTAKNIAQTLATVPLYIQKQFVE